jgi:hypothetical protein
VRAAFGEMQVAEAGAPVAEQRLAGYGSFAELLKQGYAEETGLSVAQIEAVWESDLAGPQPSRRDQVRAAAGDLVDHDVSDEAE